MAADEKNEEFETFEMEYRMLGGTGLKVSCLGFGSMTFNSKEQAKELLSVARKYGINFFDNAEIYGQPLGSCETYFGESYQELLKEDALLWRRSDLIITTKLYFGPSGDLAQENGPLAIYGENERGTLMKHIIEGMNGSLKRLKLNYVDIVFAHRWDPLTSTEECVRAFTKLINDGKAFYWGTSNWTAQKVTEAYWIAKIHNLIPPVVEQPLYNMLSREIMEKDFIPMFEHPYSLGMTTWSPLAGGLLTGKYNKHIPNDSRMGNDRLAKWYKTGNNFDESLKQKIPIIDSLIEYAKKELNETNVVNLAIAWVLKNKNVSTCLVGGSKANQIEQNMKCISLAKRMTKKNMEDIDAILKNAIPWDRDLHARSVKKIIDTIN